MGQIATCFYRLCYKETVKEETNDDYETYGHEGDVDYVTNENPDYEETYDDMETVASESTEVII